MQDNKSISRDGTDKQNLPYSLGHFWPLWELKAISGWPLLAASVVKGLTLAQKYLIFLFLIFKNVFSTSLGKRSRVETLSNLFL